MDLEDDLEKAFWRFDALHKKNYADVEPTLPGPMAERDAFKRVVRGLVTEILETQVCFRNEGLKQHCLLGTIGCIRVHPGACRLPPRGWWCSRGDGHDGPCAARRAHE